MYNWLQWQKRKKGNHRQKTEEKKREKMYQIPATQCSMTSFFLSPPKWKKFGFIIRHGIFPQKLPDLSTCCLYCLITKIFQVKDLLKVPWVATCSQLLPSYLNRRNKFLSHTEKGCNTFFLATILQHHQIYANIELVYLSLLMVFI